MATSTFGVFRFTLNFFVIKNDKLSGKIFAFSLNKPIFAFPYEKEKETIKEFFSKKMT